MDAHRPPADGTIDLGDVSTGRGDSSDPGSDAAGVLTIRALARRWAHWHDRRRWIVAALVAAGTLATLTGAAEPTAPPASRLYTAAADVEHSVLVAPQDRLYTVERSEQSGSSVVRAHDLSEQRVAWRRELPDAEAPLLQADAHSTVMISHQGSRSLDGPPGSQTTALDAATGQRLWTGSGNALVRTADWVVLHRTIPVADGTDADDRGDREGAGDPDSADGTPEPPMLRQEVSLVDRRTGAVERTFGPAAREVPLAVRGLDEGRLLVQHRDELRMIDLASAEERASMPWATDGDVAVVDGVLVTRRRVDDVHVLDGYHLDGLRHRWSTQIDVGENAHGRIFPAACGDQLCLLQEADGGLTAVDPTDGSVAWQLSAETPREGLQLLPATQLVHGHVMVRRADGASLIDPATGREALRVDEWRPPEGGPALSHAGGTVGLFTTTDDRTLVYGEIRADPLRVEPVTVLSGMSSCDYADDGYLVCRRGVEGEGPIRRSGEGQAVVVWRLAG